jgi:hypothetical protein
MKGVLSRFKKISSGSFTGIVMNFDASMYRFSLFLILFLNISVTESRSQNDLSGFEDISVLVQVEKNGSFYTDALYSEDGKLYISVEDLFKFTGIQCIAGDMGGSLEGFIGSEDHPYSINYSTGEIKNGSNTVNVKKGLVKQIGILFLESSLFGPSFGLHLTFNFRSLAVNVKSDFELPAVKERRLEKIRSNLIKNRGVQVSDTVIGREYHALNAGMVDWSIMSNQFSDHKTDTRLGLGFGAEILGGETDVLLNYSSIYKFDNRQQQYLWRWVDNDKDLIRQVQVGKIVTQSISTIYHPVIGAVISNTPTSFRRAAGEYIINDVTEPDWLVELYINNILIDFTKADASGFFIFRVPLVYGFTTLNLRFYGPMGEERSETRTMNIPYSFMPAGEFEYRLTGGFLEDGNTTPFARGEINYGVNRMLTLGTGVEYLASITTSSYIPFITASFLPLNKLMIKGEYAHEVRTRVLLNYYLWSNSIFELDYSRYVKGQKAILYNYLEERKANLSIPLYFKNIAGFAKIGYKQNVYPNFKYNIGELLLSGYYRQLSGNISTYANWVNNNSVYLNTLLAVSYRIPKGFTIRPSVQFSISKGELISYKAEVEKRFSKAGYFSVSYENLRIANYQGLNLSLKYDFSFAQADATSRFSNHGTVTSQGARGSLSFGSGNKHVQASERSSVGRGGISLIPFIDINHNDKFDEGEKIVENLSVKINGGKVIYSKKDAIIRIMGLDPFISYNLELSEKNFENISWRLKNKTYKILIDPNQYKSIEIPVIPAGEVNGTVYLKQDSITRALGRIFINIYNSVGTKIVQTLSESDGYFSYLGLDPGNYTAKIDSQQLSWLNYITTPSQIHFTVRPLEEGDIVDGLDFTLRMKPSDTISTSNVITEQPVAKKDTTLMIIHEVIMELVTIDKDSYALQMGAFKVKANAEKMRSRIEKILGKKVDIIVEDGFYKVHVPDLATREEADRNIDFLRGKGVVTEIWVLTLKAKKQQLVLREKQDTISQIDGTLLISPDLLHTAGVTVQLGAFRDKSNAMELIKQLKDRYGDRLRIVFEDGFYKLQLSGMTGVRSEILDELNKLGPNLGKLKFKDVWMSPPVVQAEKEPIVTKRPEITIRRAERVLEIPHFIKPGANPAIITNLIQSKIAKPTVQPALTISIQVGVFEKKSEAQKAQRKITSKLKLNVEIVEKWNRYIVLIRGFHTREETYIYYPELAGLGYPGVSLVEE